MQDQRSEQLSLQGIIIILRIILSPRIESG